MQHLDPGLGQRDRAGRHRGLGRGDVRARAERAGVAVAAGPVGTAEAGVAEPGEGAEQDEVEAQEEDEPGTPAGAAPARRRERGARTRRAAPARAACRRQHAEQRREVERRGRMRPARALIARPGPSLRTRAAACRCRASARRIGVDRDAHHPVAARIDEVEVVLERVARRRREPCGQGARGVRRTVVGAKCRARRRSRDRASVSRRGARVVDQPELVDTILLGAERLVQLALQPEVALAARVAGAAGDDDDEPLAAQRRAARPPRLARSASGSAPASAAAARSARCSWCAPGPQHEVGEVRGDHRRRADQQHGDHQPAAALGAAQRAASLVDGSEWTLKLTSSAESGLGGADESMPDIEEGDAAAMANHWKA